MAITQSNRRSFIGIPGITTPPVADGTIGGADRRHCCDVPFSLSTTSGPAFLFWRKVSTAIQTVWVREDDTPSGG